MDNLVSYLSTVPDPRRGEGQRHSLDFILLIVLMSVLSGYDGYRAMGDFVKRNKNDLIRYFQPHKGRLPTFDTIRRILMALDFKSFSKAFYLWMESKQLVNNGDWLSIDGKAIKGSMSNYTSAQQRFLNLISIYISRTGLVLLNGQVDNGKESEIGVVQELIKKLEIEGVTFTLDALHCQKKLRKSL